MKFLFQTQIGVENITELELEKKFKGKFSIDYVGFVPHKNGIVQIDWRDFVWNSEAAPRSGEADNSSPENSNLQNLDFYKSLGTVEDSFFVLDYIKDVSDGTTPKDLMRQLDIGKIKKNLDFFYDKLNTFGNSGKFRFVTRKKSFHDFRRLDLNREIKTFFERNINRVEVTEEEGVKEIWTTLVKNRLIIGVRLTTKEKRHGYYKTAMVHGSLRPTVANALAFITDINSKDSLWDPFCGAGTIGCEIVDNFKFGKLILSDISEEALTATKENLSNTKGFKQFKGKVSIKKQEFFDSKDFATTIISNLPFGTQYLIDEDFEQNFINKLQTIKNLKQVTLLFPEVINIPNFQLTRKFEIEVLGRKCFALVYKKIST